MSAYCTYQDVKQRMTGKDVPALSDGDTSTIAEIITEVSSLIDGEVRRVRGQGEDWTFLPGTPVTRRYSGVTGGSNLLVIDDAVAVSSVTLLDSTGNTIQTLTANTDWLPYPLNGLPIVGLRRTAGAWPETLGGVSVTLTPGYANAVPADITTAAVAEVIRTLRGGQAGEDDRLGMTPFQTVVVSKALLQSTMRTVMRYRFGGAHMRSAG